jgi:hypothetical protein
MSKDYIGFTMDLRKLVSVLGQDPTCRAEIQAGLQGVPEPLTSQLGAANMAEKGAEPDWCSLFPATVQGKNSGEEGLFYRNSSNGGAGDRVQMRLKRQTQPYTQPAQPQYQVPTAASAPVIGPVGAPTAEQEAALSQLQTNPLFAQLLEALAAQQGPGQLNVAEQSQAPAAPPLEAPAPEAAKPEVPADIQAILNQTQAG